MVQSVRLRKGRRDIAFKMGFLEYFSCSIYDFWTVEAPNPFLERKQKVRIAERHVSFTLHPHLSLHRYRCI
jgi:hypothetical protein